MTGAVEQFDRNLSLALRPQRFSDMIGADDVLKTIKNQFESGRIPRGLMFVGEPGAGKTTISRILSIAVQCDHGEFGEPCDECLQDADCYAIIERNCANLSKLEDARNLLENIVYTPAFGKYRVIILDEAQKLSPDAQQCLLKPMEPEEGSPNIFIIGTTDPEKIIPALQKRCLRIDIPGMDKLATARLVELAVGAAGQHEHLSDYVPLVELLVESQVTSPRDILMAVEKALSGTEFEKCIFNDGISGDINLYDLFKATVQGNWNTVRNMLEGAKPADAGMLKMRLSAFYRGGLLKAEGNSTRGDLMSQFIFELADHQTPETGLQLSALMASLYRICQIASDAKKAAA